MKKVFLFLFVLLASFFNHSKEPASYPSRDFFTPFQSSSIPTEFEELLNKKPVIDNQQAYLELKAAEQRSAAKTYGYSAGIIAVGGVATAILGKYLQSSVLEGAGLLAYTVAFGGLIIASGKYAASLYNDSKANRLKNDESSE